MKRYLAIITAILFNMMILAGFAADYKPGQVRGKIVDEATQAPLIAVNVVIQNTQYGAATNEKGEFTISDVPAGHYAIQLSMIGYETRIVNNVVVTPGRTTWQSVDMKQTVLEGEGVTVTAGYFHEAKDAVTSNRSMDFEEIRMDPGSAEDIQRVVQALPSVVSGSDQENEIIVRGGMPGENLFIMDNIEIPNPNHFGFQGTGGGPVSMINTRFVRRIDFYAGAFPARYGDKASSVLDITLREGNRERVSGHAFLGMSGAGAMVEGPIQGGKGAYLLSGSKSFLDLIIQDIGLSAVPYYYNLQGKITYDLSDQDLLSINGFYGNDHITIEDDDESGGYDRGADNVRSKSHQYAYGATWRHLIGINGFSRVTLSQSANHWDQYVYRSLDDPYYTNLSNEIERTLKADITWLPSKNSEISIGGQVKQVDYAINIWSEADTIFTYTTQGHIYKTGIYKTYDEFLRDDEETAYKAAGFMHLKWLPWKRLTLSGGLRTDYFDYTGKRALDPRVGISFGLTSKLNLNLALGQHSQSPAYLQLTCHPNNKNLDYKKTSQIVVGLEKLFRDDMRGTLEVYYKDYRDVPVSLSSLDPNPFESSYGELINYGRGFAKGVELFLQKKLTNHYRFTMSYAYSQSKGVDPRYDKVFNWDYDYRHVFTLISGIHYNLFDKAWYQKISHELWFELVGWMLPIADQVEISFRWRYLGGRPYTEHTYYRGIRTWAIDEETPLNALRYPVYHRLDLRIDRRYLFNGWNMVTYFDFINVYGRNNIWGYSYYDDGTKENIYQWKVFPVGGITIEM